MIHYRPGGLFADICFAKTEGFANIWIHFCTAPITNGLHNNRLEPLGFPQLFVYSYVNAILVGNVSESLSCTASGISDSQMDRRQYLNESTPNGNQNNTKPTDM